jgi:ribosomal protein S18 acetylase RimI-like enzyme
VQPEVVLDCGWGRIVFGQTFTSADRLTSALRAEASGHRDICIYPREPHVLIAQAPSELFLDPSHTYRLDLRRYTPGRGSHAVVRSIEGPEDAAAMNAVYASAGMLQADPSLLLRNAETHVHLPGRRGAGHRPDRRDGHRGRPRRGLRRPRGRHQPVVPGRRPAEPAGRRGRPPDPRAGRALRRPRPAYVDLSVLHDNRAAINLYERVGFVRVPVLSLKRKNTINERLFVTPPSESYQRLNPYARIIADEARRRGHRRRGAGRGVGRAPAVARGRSILTRESLSELTTAVAMSRCDDKRVTRRIAERAGLSVPRGRTATGDQQDLAFLAEVGDVVVKPARGEQGQGITVGVHTPTS